MRFYFLADDFNKTAIRLYSRSRFPNEKDAGILASDPHVQQGMGYFFRYLNGSRSAQIELHCQEIGPASECGAAGLESGEDHCSGWLLFGETRFQMPSKRMRIRAACEQGEMDFTVACKSRSPIPVRKCSHLKTGSISQGYQHACVLQERADELRMLR